MDLRQKQEDLEELGGRNLGLGRWSGEDRGWESKMELAIDSELRIKSKLRTVELYWVGSLGRWTFYTEAGYQERGSAIDGGFGV